MNRTLSLAVALWAFTAGAARPYRGGVVASGHPLASQAALEMLNRGGNAVDAAVAAAFTLGVVLPYYNGVGGGGFALTWENATATGKVLDFREVAPQGASREMFVRDGKAVPTLSTDFGPSVGVPGAVAGYLELLRAEGKLKPQVVLAPAIKAASEGFWVSPRYQIQAKYRLECLRANPDAARIFLRPGPSGTPEVPAIGTLIRQPELARTLRAIAERGAGAFYLGSVAQRMEQTVKAGGGVLTAADLAAFKVRWRKPLEGDYRGHHILAMPPPSGGGLAVLQVLGALETLRPQGVTYRDAATVHLMVEAERLAYVDRAKLLGDPAFSDLPLAKLSSPAYIAEQAHRIDPAHATATAKLLPLPSGPAGDGGPGGAAPEKKNTTHLSVIDKDGNAVALTTTVNGPFGSCLVAQGTGILLNNQMDDFAAQPMVPNSYGLVTGEANSVAPGKIPLSSMSPTLVFAKGDPKKVMIAVGSPGGSTIPTTVIQAISNIIDLGMDVSRAVSSGRVHHQAYPDLLMVDRYGLEPETQKALEALGHHVKNVPAWGDAEAVYADPETGLRYSASDPRNEGTGLGQD